MAYRGYKRIDNKKCEHPQGGLDKIHNSTDKIDTIILYINLLLEKQNFILSKFDHVDFVMSKLLKENDKVKEHIELLENKTKSLSDKLENVYGYLTSQEDEWTNDNGENSENDDDSEKKSCNHINFEPIKNIGNKKNIKKEDNGIVIKVQDNQSQQMNPFEMLLGHLSNMDKPKPKVEEVDSDDEYDGDEPIYCEDIVLTNDENFVELPKKLTNIGDLIELGSFYDSLMKQNGELLKNQDVSENKNTKNKKKNKHGKKALIENEIIPEMSMKNMPLYELYELNGKKYGINLEIVSNLTVPLKRLAKMIGMKKVKEDIFEMIIYYLQGFEKRNRNMLHSVIEGPPGVGKTRLGKIMSKIYCALGIIPSSNFKYVKSTDLIGDHVGATKHMTQAAIDEADGGVLFIDEAYALSSNDNKDPYGKECIDTLNFNLSENKKKLIVIIAGYSDHLDKYFFSFNPGLARRFPFRFKIDNYTPTELRDIFIDKLRRNKWKLDKDVTMVKLTDFFKTNEKCFPNFGGDIENLFKSCQFSHSKRIIGKNPVLRGNLIMEDISKGLEKFKKNKRDSDKSEHLSMYA
jgi:hypothetical protein